MLALRERVDEVENRNRHEDAWAGSLGLTCCRCLSMQSKSGGFGMAA